LVQACFFFLSSSHFFFILFQVVPIAAKPHRRNPAIRTLVSDCRRASWVVTVLFDDLPDYSWIEGLAMAAVRFG